MPQCTCRPVCSVSVCLLSFWEEIIRKCVSIGLKEGAIVTCTVVPDVPVLSSISVTANTQKDWEMLVSES